MSYLSKCNGSQHDYSNLLSCLISFCKYLQSHITLELIFLILLIHFRFCFQLFFFHNLFLFVFRLSLEQWLLRHTMNIFALHTVKWLIKAFFVFFAFLSFLEIPLNGFLSKLWSGKRPSGVWKGVQYRWIDEKLMWSEFMIEFLIKNWILRQF